jgi:broad specificity phosphatase PhoE
MIFTLPAATIYDLSGRVSGWREPTTPRAELQKLDALIPRLRELGITRIVGSDFAEKSVKRLARQLEVPFELWESLRRFNAGKLHGTDSRKFEKLYDSVQSTPIVPVKGGDSRASYEKRMAAARDHLRKLPSTTLVVAEGREVISILQQGVPDIRRCRLYGGEVPGGESASAASV